MKAGLHAQAFHKNTQKNVIDLKTRMSRNATYSSGTALKAYQACS